MSNIEMQERRQWMDKDQKKKLAMQFLSSIRGQYILSQALCLAIEKLESVDGVHKEVSNINDMKLLLDHVFPMCKGIKNG
tara:strand:- start:860 stop:1099 length:240 start_codon:yes stop_codon:yes gene_type:complete